MKLVIDTSVVAKSFLNEPDRLEASGVIEAALASRVELLAPSLMLYEINNVFVSKGVRGAAYDNAIAMLMKWIDASVIDVCEADEDLLRRAAALAAFDTKGQGHISSFDATFHALALREGATFLTADAAYVRKTQALVGRVTLLSDFKS